MELLPTCLSPFLKAFWHRYLPGRYTSRLNFVQFRSTRYDVDFKFYQAYCKPRQNILRVLLGPITLASCVFFRINLDTSIQKAQYRRHRRLEDDESRLLSGTVRSTGSLNCTAPAAPMSLPGEWRWRRGSRKNAICCTGAIPNRPVSERYTFGVCGRCRQSRYRSFGRRSRSWYGNRRTRLPAMFAGVRKSGRCQVPAIRPGSVEH
jgi:hypothetical protein